MGKKCERRVERKECDTTGKLSRTAPNRPGSAQWNVYSKQQAKQTKLRLVAKAAHLVRSTSSVRPAIIHNIHPNPLRRRIDPIRDKIIRIPTTINTVIALAINATLRTRILGIIEPRLHGVQKLLPVHRVQINVASHRLARVRLESQVHRLTGIAVFTAAFASEVDGADEVGGDDDASGWGRGELALAARGAGDLGSDQGGAAEKGEADLVAAIGLGWVGERAGGRVVGGGCGGVRCVSVGGVERLHLGCGGGEGQAESDAAEQRSDVHGDGVA